MSATPTNTFSRTFFGPLPSSTSSSSGGFGSGFGGPGAFGGSVFIVILVVLFGIAFLVALRAIRVRRRLHRAWAQTGYSDSFFEPGSEYYDLQQRWGSGGQSRYAAALDTLLQRQRKTQDKLGERPEMVEVEIEEKAEWKDKEWDLFVPVGANLLMASTPGYTSQPAGPPPIVHTPPTFWETIRSAPVRPPPPPPPPPVEPVPLEEALVPGQSEIEVGVLIAFPVDDKAEVQEREDGEREVPEVWLGVANLKTI